MIDADEPMQGRFDDEPARWGPCVEERLCCTCARRRAWFRTGPTLLAAWCGAGPHDGGSCYRIADHPHRPRRLPAVKRPPENKSEFKHGRR